MKDEDAVRLATAANNIGKAIIETQTIQNDKLGLNLHLTNIGAIFSLATQYSNLLIQGDKK